MFTQTRSLRNQRRIRDNMRLAVRRSREKKKREEQLGQRRQTDEKVSFWATSKSDKIIKIKTISVGD